MPQGQTPVPSDPLACSPLLAPELGVVTSCRGHVPQHQVGTEVCCFLAGGMSPMPASLLIVLTV